MTYRAFFSHYSGDNDFARLVSAELDRASIIYDERDFEIGEPFSSEIARLLASAGIFVLLASPQALERSWVKLEIGVAESLTQAGVLANALVFLYKGATVDDLPDWLKQARATYATSPVQMATIIRELQTNLIDQNQNPTFQNRFEELRIGEAALYGRRNGGASSRRTVAFYGPAGIGRHSLARRLFQTTCNLTKRYSIPVESADDYCDLAIKLATFSERYHTRAELKLLIETLEHLSDDDLDARVTAYVATLVSNNILLILEDAGGLLNDNGVIPTSLQRFIDKVENISGAYCGIISRRNPRSVMGVAPSKIRVAELDNENAQNITRRYAELSVLHLQDGQLAELVGFVGGHPPSLRYAVELCKDRGVEAVLRNKAWLAKHNLENYWDEIRSDKKLTDIQKQLLVTTAFYGPAPLSVLAGALGRTVNEVVDSLEYVLDMVLLNVDDIGFYALPSPLMEIVTRLFPDVVVDHDAAFVAIEEFLSRNPDTQNRLALERARGRALALGTRPDKDQEVIALASDLVAFAEQSYRAEKYGPALDYAKAALERRPRNPEAIRVFIQSLVKRQRFNDAMTYVNEHRLDMEAQDVAYYRGFIERGRGRYAEAIVFYSEAVAQGRRGLAIHRELADCYFNLRNVEEALREIALAKRSPVGRENRFLLALEVKIAIYRNQEEKARETLEVCERVDQRHHYLLLLARVNLAFGAAKAALGEVERAKAIRGRDSFEGTYLRAVANITLHMFDEAGIAIQAIGDRTRIDRAALIVALLWARGQRDAALDEFARYGEPQDLIAIRDFVKLGLDPNDKEAQTQLARLLVNLQSGLPLPAGEADASSDIDDASDDEA